MSAELTDDQRRSFEEHLRECPECRAELEAYTRERETLFAPDILAEEPSETVNAEILRVCGSSRPAPTGLGLLAGFMLKPVAAVLFLALGMAGGVYVAYQLQTPASAPSGIAAEAPSHAPVVSDSATEVASESDAADSLESDSAGTSRPFGDGGAAAPGVVPVDVQR
jgi:anti-sigma factor RsiW